MPDQALKKNDKQKTFTSIKKINLKAEAEIPNSP